jgi:hypothetical protein
MHAIKVLAAALWAAVVFCHGALALDCPPAEGRSTVQFAGEVAGKNAFNRGFGPGWTFVLEVAEKGWNIRVMDRDWADLSALSPPRISPHMRELYGWHFRNAANSGPNTGEINAPQSQRFLSFATDAGMTDPAGPMPGRLMLELQDFGLADLDPGEQARMVYAQFAVCISWPEDANIMPVPPAVEGQFRACGLPAPYRLEGWARPVSFDLDFDGDGRTDTAALAVRDNDGKRGLAICRREQLSLIGFDAGIGELHPGYFESMTDWGFVPRGPVGTGATGEAPPELVGDAILLAKAESSSVLLYWTQDGFRSYWQGD